MVLKGWRLLSSKKDGSYRIFSIRTDTALSPRTGMEHDFFVLESSPWVNVIPLTPEGNVVLIRQYRHGIRDMTLEIPGGLVEEGDSPMRAAERELSEETGYRAREIVELGWVHPNPAILNNICYTYLAKDVYPAGHQCLDEKEDIEIVLRPISDVPGIIKKGQITHALVLAGFYRFFMENQAGRFIERILGAGE